MLSYEDWDNLGQPQLRPIDEMLMSTLIGRVCIGSFITKVYTQGKMCHCHFYVANKNRMQEGAIVNLPLLVKSRYLYEPESPQSHKVTELPKAMEKPMMDSSANVSTTSPQL